MGMDGHRFEWIGAVTWIGMYVDIHGYPWMSMQNHGYPLISIHFHAFPCVSVAKRGPTISAPSQAPHLGVMDLNPSQQWSAQDFQQPPPHADRGARPPDPPRRTQPP